MTSQESKVAADLIKLLISSDDMKESLDVKD